MKNTTLGGYKTINSYVAAKIEKFEKCERTFAPMFELMFSEKENILYEKSEGFALIKTTYGSAYGNILKLTDVLAARLEGCEPDSIVGISMDNSLEWIEIFWTVLRCGFRPLLMNLRLDKGTLEKALTDSGAVAVISDGTDFCVKTLKADELVKAALFADGAEKGNAGSASAEHGEMNPQPRPRGSFGSEVLVMSSGTSLNVKLCAYGAEEFYHQIRDSYAIILKCGAIKRHYRGQLKLLTFLPFYHIFGLVAMYIWFSFFSRTFVELKDMQPNTILTTIRRHDVTHIFAVPLFWEKVYNEAMKTINAKGPETAAKFEKGMKIADRLAKCPKAASAFSKLAFKEVRENLFGESISFLIAGGSMIPAEVLRFFNNIGYRLADGYGMSEIGITSVELDPHRNILNGAFVGKPLSSVSYRLADDGELLVKSLSMASYIIEGGVRRERADWFATRDLAECVNGHYRILGRKDDLVISPSGENMNPNIIEPMLAVPAASGVCLLAEKSGVDSKPVLLVSIACEDLRSEAEEQIKARIAECGLNGMIQKLVITTQPLMREDEFKLNRSRLGRDLAAGAFDGTKDRASGSGTEDADELMTVVRRYFAEALGRDISEIGPDTDFFLELGGTSLDYFSMVGQMCMDFNVEFPEDDGRSCNTAREICEYINSLK